MAPRSAPTARQRRLGTELRRLREAAGLSAHEAAALLGADRTMISNIEAGRVGISEERLRTMAEGYGCPDRALIDALAAMTGVRVRVRSHWWEEYRGKLPPGLLDASETEHYATRLRTTRTVGMPALLRTEDHARALLDLVVPAPSRLEVELRLAHGLARRTVLERTNPTPYRAVVHEAALRIPVGGPRTARAQLTHLLEVSERERVRLAVIPFTAGAFPAAGQPILYAEGPVRQLDTVRIDAAHEALHLDAPGHLAVYREVLDRTERTALSTEASRDLIHTIAREL